MKLIINKCYGGFGISHKAIMRYAELSGFALYVIKNSSESLLHPKFVYINPEDVQEEDWDIHYVTKPLNKNGTYKTNSYWYYGNLNRDDPVLVKVVEELGTSANGRFADLKVVEIPDNTQYEIEEYDGIEWVSEVHNTWS